MKMDVEFLFSLSIIELRGKLLWSRFGYFIQLIGQNRISNSKDRFVALLL